MVCVLFSRPDHDIILSYLYIYSKELVNSSISLGHKTINKEKHHATRKNIVGIIQKQKPELIMFNGHGNEKIICGHDDEIIIQSDINGQVLCNTITYSLACSSSAELGPSVVINGGCFIGYEFDFALGRDPDSEASPHRDKIAKLFLEPSNILFSSLLKGNEAKEAVEKAKKKMKENVWYLNTTNDFPEASYYAPFLFGNYLSLVVHGNKNASIA